MLVAFFIACLSSSVNALPFQDDEKLVATGTTMGVVTWNVTAYGDLGESGSQKTEQIETAIATELESVNQMMSTYIKDSDVSQFNLHEGLDWFTVSSDTALVVSRALEISKRSAGAFDITVQPLVQLWKFGTDKDQPGIPAGDAIEEALKQIGYQHLQVRLDPPALKKSKPTLQIDLSAIAKGYAVDRVAKRLGQLDIENFLVEVGGEVRASGEKPEAMPWKVGIEKPLAIKREPYQVVELYHKSLASSGDYRNYFTVDGKKYSHTIDPRTGKPVEHDVASTSVIADDCMTADALATALMVLGPKAGLELAESMKVQAMFLTRQGSKLVATATESFPKNSVASNQPKQSSDLSFFRMMAVASVLFAVAIVAMAIGVIFGRERIKGSCGGIAALDNPDIKPECSLCSRAAECDELKEAIKNRSNETAD